MEEVKKRWGERIKQGYKLEKLKESRAGGGEGRKVWYELEKEGKRVEVEEEEEKEVVEV